MKRYLKPKGETPKEKPVCSFCGRSHSLVGVLFQGEGEIPESRPGICQHCLKEAQEVMVKSQEKPE